MLKAWRSATLSLWTRTALYTLLCGTPSMTPSCQTPTTGQVSASAPRLNQKQNRPSLCPMSLFLCFPCFEIIIPLSQCKIHQKPLNDATLLHLCLTSLNKLRKGECKVTFEIGHLNGNCHITSQFFITSASYINLQCTWGPTWWWEKAVWKCGFIVETLRYILMIYTSFKKNNNNIRMCYITTNDH